MAKTKLGLRTISASIQNSPTELRQRPHVIPFLPHIALGLEKILDSHCHRKLEVLVRSRKEEVGNRKNERVIVIVIPALSSWRTNGIGLIICTFFARERPMIASYV